MAALLLVGMGLREIHVSGHGARGAAASARAGSRAPGRGLHGEDEAFLRGVGEKPDVLAKRRTSAGDEGGNVFVLLREEPGLQELDVLEHVGYPLASSDAVRVVVDVAPLKKLGSRLAKVAIFVVVEGAVAGGGNERDIVGCSAESGPSPRETPIMELARGSSHVPCQALTRGAAASVRRNHGVSRSERRAMASAA